MKGKDIITHAIRAEMPDMAQLRENSIRQATQEATMKRSVLVKRLVPAACLVVVLAVIIAFPHFIRNHIEISGTAPNGVSDSKNNSPIDSTMHGLPVKNFNLADVENDGKMMDRIGFLNFGSFFEYGADYFAVVKITDTQIQKGKSDGYFELQVSDAYVLQSLYKESKSRTIQITQSVINDHFCLGTTNLLRKGGVYLLPLAQTDGKWHILGDMDVLFEIDDKGNVWSHSDFEDFNRYDGKSVEFLINELKNMFSNDDFMLANSPFSGALRGWTLADITISNKSIEKTDKNGNRYFNYAFTVHEILSDPSHSNSVPIEDTGNIKVYTDESDAMKLLPGNRYLICLDRYEDEIYMNSRMIAKVGNDETITAMLAPDNQSYLGASIFAPYDGYKISDIREMVLRIDAWRETHG